MEERYKNMSKLGVGNIDGFNARVAEAAAKGETLMRTVQTGYESRDRRSDLRSGVLDAWPCSPPHTAHANCRS
jgi:DNA segregation ATPase FtsK/SpoIIIE-like protein